MDTIRQMLLFSFEELYKMQTETRLELALRELQIPAGFGNLFKGSNERGPKGYSPKSMLYAIFAMRIEKIPNISALVRRLKSDMGFRYACGFDVLGKTPSASCFSRFLHKLEATGILQEMFHDSVESANALGLLSLKAVAIDATAIDSFEAPKPKAKLIDDGNHPNWGMKRDTHGNTFRWFGWKYHLICDTASGLPVAYHITTASVHDAAAVRELMDSLANKHPQIHPKYWLYDSGYDSVWLYNEVLENRNGYPIIAYNGRGAFAPPTGFDEKLHPVCSGGYQLTYWGRDGDYLKFRCPHATGHVDCPHGMKWCSDSNYGMCLKLRWKDNPRILSYPIRSSDAWKKIYNQRTSVERLNHLLKNNLGANNLRSAGKNMAELWLLVSMIALYAGSKATLALKATKTAA